MRVERIQHEGTKDAKRNWKQARGRENNHEATELTEVHGELLSVVGATSRCY